jgi:hypothetical protein
MIRFLLALIGALIIFPLQAQQASSMMVPPSPSTIFRLSLLSPSFIAEFAPTDQFTVSTGFWISTDFFEFSSPDETFFLPAFTPSFTVEPRYYFNLESRKAQGKRTDYYSGWFVAAPFHLEIPDLRYSLGGVIGFQRTLGKRGYWNISMGPRLIFEDSRFRYDGDLDLGLGIILNKM